MRQLWPTSQVTCTGPITSLKYKSGLTQTTQTNQISNKPNRLISSDDVEHLCWENDAWKLGKK
uniref:Uncharacterized protein n=1 Tax=Ciona intestinalis TaxID=7719 RepID=H2Y053_CIOIN